MKRLTPAERKRGFRIHGIMFVLWVLGWSIGLFCHWYFVLGPGARKGKPT